MKLNEIMNYEMDKDKKSSLQMKAVKFLVFFLILMFLLTIIARAADSVTITKVTVTQASGMAISHDIEVDGTVSSVKDIAISTVANVKIDSVNTSEGKLISKGDVMFVLNKEDLEKQLKTAQNDLKAARKEIADAKKEKENQKKEAQKAKEAAAKSKAQAREDYNDTVNAAAKTLKRAKKKMVSARKTYRRYKNKKKKRGSVADSSVGDSLQKNLEDKQTAYNKAQSAMTGLRNDIEAEVQEAIKAASKDSEGNVITLTQPQKQAVRDKINASEKNQKLLNEAQENIDNAKSEMDDAQTAVEEYSSERASLSKLSYKEQLKTLKDEYKSAKSEYEAAKDQYDSTVKEAKRTLRDALSSADDSSSDDTDTSDVSSGTDTDDTDTEEGSGDSSGDGTDIADKQKTVDTISDLVKADGQVRAPSDGLVTKFSAEVGDTTTEDTIMRISDQNSGYSFTGTIEKSSAQYLSKGDKVKLEFGNGVSVDGLKINSIEVSPNDSSSYDITVNIPSKVKKITTFATLKADKASKKYDTCVPLECLHSDGNDYYVYTVSESQTVLGIEDKVDKVSVSILDKNAENAAIDGSFNYDEKFVLKASKTLNDRDRVRIITGSDDSSDDGGNDAEE